MKTIQLDAEGRGDFVRGGGKPLRRKRSKQAIWKSASWPQKSA
jgi:hypothetical protein